MQNINESLELLKTIADGLGKQFGEKCEIVIHDYLRPFESSIVHIVNGSVTNRKVGDSGSKIGLLVYKGEKLDDGKFNYITRTNSGKILRSSTFYIKNDKKETVGSMCINFDMTDLYISANILDEFINYKSDEQENRETDIQIFSSVNDLLSNMINDSIKYVGIPVIKMSREQKIDGIQYLNQRGAFTIKNAAQEVAKFYNVSKFTIYNYINEKID